MGMLIGAGSTEPAGATGWPGTLPHLLLHGLRQRLRALAQGVERAALRIHRAVGIALAQTAFGLAHGLAGAAELIQFVLTLLALSLLALALLALLVLAKAAVFDLFQQLVDAILQPLPALPQLADAAAL